ncbi:MAG TPA: MFS transporter [Steroidobacteraceae bacterium]|nr:MFS transporter [Steroidobacteraceae bacterium]
MARTVSAIALTSEERPQLTSNQWKVVSFCAVGGMLEIMDVYIIAFILAVITKPWKLSYGESAGVLLASGVGAVVGSFFWGYVADRVGRKRAFVATIVTCSAASLALVFTPQGNWMFLATLRTIVGFGTGGFFIFVVLVQEFVPASTRGFVCGLISGAAAGGLLLGAISGSFLMPIIGWRGLFAVGAVPIFLGIAVVYLMPESPRWALSRGDVALARRSLAWALGAGADIESVVRAYSTAERPPAWREVLSHPRSLITGTVINFGVVTAYYGIVLWAPTLLAQIERVSGAQAAKMMMAMSLAGLLCRLTTGWLSDRVGRRPCGAVAACGAAVCLVIAGLVGHSVMLHRELFWLPFAAAFLLADCSFAIMGMYTSEIWPSRLRGRGSGVSYGAGSVGKIIGPLGLALVIGSSSVISPAATVGAIVPAFGYLAAMLLIAGATYLFVARETRGRSLEDLDREA